MLRAGCESSSGRYLLKLMPVHRARRAGNVGGRSGFVYVEQCVTFVVEQVFSGMFE